MYRRFTSLNGAGYVELQWRRANWQPASIRRPTDSRISASEVMPVEQIKGFPVRARDLRNGWLVNSADAVL